MSHDVFVEIVTGQSWAKAGESGRTVQPVCSCGWEGPTYPGHDEARADRMATAHRDKMKDEV